jgi:CubicO group peptidase (beta-lactamase class C family)
MKKIISLFILITFYSIPSFAQISKIETAIQQIFQEEKVAGLSVAVVKKNKIIYTHSFGKKNLETGEPLTNENIFRIASISKSFSATSIMQLVEAGKISLDEDVSNLVGFKIRNPKYPETVITLKLLLSHLSSINDSEGYFSLDYINPAKNPNWAKCYNDYEPGKGYQYCNLNFNMVGTIIERTSGERFDQYVKHHILDPIGLYGGYCVDSLDKTKFASIYDYNADSAKFILSPNAYAPRSEEIANYTMGYSTPIFSPTGGMKISATDLAKYMTMHMNYGKYKGVKIMSKKSAKQMQTPLSEEEQYGFAIENTTKMIDGVQLTGHTGSAYGLFSAMFFDPKKKFGIVVISNGCDPNYTNGYNKVIKRTMNILYDLLIVNIIKTEY